MTWGLLTGGIGEGESNFRNFRNGWARPAGAFVPIVTGPVRRRVRPGRVLLREIISPPQ